jgi:DNA-binding GntR family transcriptional regulator
MAELQSSATNGGTGRISRTHVAYDELRTMIVHGNIRPNERLIEVDLAERLNVSRTPVREALQRLASDGLVVSARRGWVVREMTLTEIVEIYEVRESLEGYAAGRAAERATDEQIAEISDIIARRPKNPPPADRRELLVLENNLFHVAIFRAARNARLHRTIERNGDYYYNIQLAQLYSDAELSASIRQHSAIMHAIAAHDAVTAERVMREHIRDALAVIVRHHT